MVALFKSGPREDRPTDGPSAGRVRPGGGACGASAVCAVVTAYLVASSAASPQRAHAQNQPAVVRNTFLGVAHVDVADLHVIRRPDAPPQAVETLGAADLADRYVRAAALGVAWHRWSVYWDLADRGGTFDWTASDGIVGRDVSAGLRSLVVIHGNPPGVVNLAGAPADVDAPVFLDAAGAPVDDPKVASRINPQNTFARFVAATVDRYRPGGSFAAEKGLPAAAGVRAWQIGNEPNSASFWRGTPADFARYLEVGYLAAKWVDPDATVVHGGMANDANAEVWFAQFLDALRARAEHSPLPAQHGYFFDKTAWHWYTAPSNLTVGRPETVRRLLAERGIPAKPLWVTEFGGAVWSEYPGPCWDAASPGRFTAAEQAGFVWQSLAEGLVAGAELMVYYQLYDDCGNGRQSYDAFGLVRNHGANQCWASPGQGCWSLDASAAGTPRPAYEALRSAARELSGVSSARANTSPDGTTMVTLARRGAARVTVAWNASRRDRTATVPAIAARATLFELDAAGNVRTRSASAAGARFSLFLAGATNRNGPAGAPITAGRPVILVEAGAAPGQAADAPAASRTSNPASAAPPGSSGLVRGAPAAGIAPGDVTPPILAIVGALAARSEPLFDLDVLAADEESGLAGYQVLYAVGAPPTSVSDWQTYVAPLSWPGTPLYGQVSLPFVGAPGRTYYFAATAGDLAGNWTPVPSYVQAVTTIAGVPEARGKPPAHAIRARSHGTPR